METPGIPPPVFTSPLTAGSIVIPMNFPRRYRDFGDAKRFEGPFDFCGEAELPGLLAKLKKIRAYGGDDRQRRDSLFSCGVSNER